MQKYFPLQWDKVIIIGFNINHIKFYIISSSGELSCSLQFFLDITP